jgi:hypothetical protein
MSNTTATFIAIALITLFVGTLWFFMRKAPLERDEIIIGQLQKIKTALEKVHQDCTIIGFEDEGGNRNKCYIDFLTIKSFVGSEAGSLNLSHPEKWQGPYLNDNPTMQECFYYIIKIDGDHYIVPGNGIKLANGKTIGKEIIIDEKSDIKTMIAPNGDLNFKGSTLAVKLDLTKQPELAITEQPPVAQPAAQQIPEEAAA